MKLIDHGAPQISLAQAEFEQAAKFWQQQAAEASAKASRYTELARWMGFIYKDALKRSEELGD